ncbi:protein LURP-one-related 4 [Cinnamomum micranthum f. kanehirae]|uniref:Protein LURP-one-related 4 n=1 Tax=Cinnamomum micranthum f. kanehirae TaxID=337451 RepID=A0A3S3MN72_9MAGN|nr:protein LURP-one-related 4 [Cinnamomum micranthum f. kanehirae]
MERIIELLFFSSEDIYTSSTIFTRKPIPVKGCILLLSSPLHPTSNYMTSTRETFTIWMKSLIFNGNGCTVYDSDGQIVYRIDNYNRKCSKRVYLMDLRGNVLITILRKKYSLLGHWEGYTCSDLKLVEEKPWFRVRKAWKFPKGKSPCEVTMGWDKDQSNCYRIKAAAGKPDCQIVDQTGRLVAEQMDVSVAIKMKYLMLVKQKQSSSGVSLGDDVLTLVVEPNTNHSFIMGLVVVYGLINHRM